MLEEVKQTFNDIRDAIIEMGVDVDYCDSPAEYASKILSITTGGEGSGKTLLFVPVFKSSTTKPSKPTGTMSASNPTNYPSGWGTPDGLSTPIWMSYTIVGTNVTYVSWTDPICLSGSGSTGNSSSKLFTVFANIDKDIASPNTPTGGTWDTTSNTLSGLVTSTATDGSEVVWYSTYETLSDMTVWVSSAVFASDGTICGGWSEPFKLGSANSSGSSELADVYISYYLYATTESYETAPEVPVTVTTYDATTNTLNNPPEGWSDSAESTTEKPYVWRITGNFSQNKGIQIGSWFGPIRLTGMPGPAGEDGDEIQEVFALSTVTVTPTIDESTTDSNGKTKADDDYLPTFKFNDTTVEAIAEKVSVSSTNPYLYGTYRRKHNGTWSSYFSPYLINNFVQAALTDEEKAEIQERVTSELSTELDAANTRVSAVETRLDKIDGTDATFFTDNREALVSAVTSYTDANQNSFADLIVNGKESTIKEWAGAEVDSKLTGAELTLDGLKGVVEQWGTFYDETTMSTGSVRQILDAEAKAITTAATTQVDDKISTAQTTWDAEKASITNDVAKASYFWAKYETSSNGVQKIMSKQDYDLSDVGDGKTYADVAAYEDAMGNAGWQRATVIDALSTITQEAGSIKITASSGDGTSATWASIVAEANEDSSSIRLDADRIDLSGTTNAQTAVIGKATITDASITDGTITNATITGGTIESQLKSANYTATAGQQKGFLLDAAGNQFALYGSSDGNNIDTIITSSEVSIPAATITGTLDADHIDTSTLKVTGSMIVEESITANQIKGATITAAEIAGNTITADELANNTITGVKIANGTIMARNIAANTITADKIAANTITTKELAADVLLSKNITFTDDSGNTYASFSKAVTSLASDHLVISGKDVTFNNDSGTTVGKLTFGDDGSLSLDTSKLGITAGDVDFTTGTFTIAANHIKFTKKDGTSADDFGTAVASFAGDVLVDGEVTAKALKTSGTSGTTTDGTTTVIENGNCLFIAPGETESNKKNYIEIGWETGTNSNEKNMVLKFYSNGSCLYNLGPAGFIKL